MERSEKVVDKLKPGIDSKGISFLEGFERGGIDYYGMSAQLKTVIDRFCSFNASVTRKQVKSALLAVAWNADDWTFDALEAHYDTLVRYLKMQDVGRVLGRGCGTPSMTRSSRYPDEAYRLGRSL